MGEALIVSRGSSSGGSSGKTLISQIFIENTIWKAPKIPDQNFSVRIFGGGGGSSNYGGGGGGYMNNAILKINAGEEIPITIGTGGTGRYSAGDNGEISSFGIYLSALGGEGGNDRTGGNGGSGGAALTNGGTGFQFGGGGGSNGGNGGKWGGGGGAYGYGKCGKGGCLYENSQNIYEITGYSGLAGDFNNNGTNTIGMGLEFEGAGRRGQIDLPEDANGRYGDGQPGGGGYGGNGGNIYYISSNGRHYYNYSYSYGGGGGYGGKGGDGRDGAGGGGGYGADGGNGASYRVFGGGGGYGKLGKGGGAGKLDGGIAAGGAAYYNGNGLGTGGNGICIIQYYI